jgi:threonine dehydratase
LVLDAKQSTAGTHNVADEAVPFPPYDHLDVIHGHGTIALEFEQEFTNTVQGSAGLPCGRDSTLDFVVCDFDDGIILSGICMAFAGTRTQVVGAAPMTGFWEHAARQRSADIPMRESYEHTYWEGVKFPMASIPWATFTARGHLSSVLEVDDEQMHAASVVAREHYGVHLEPDNAVPLAVA